MISLSTHNIQHPRFQRGSNLIPKHQSNYAIHPTLECVVSGGSLNQLPPAANEMESLSLYILQFNILFLLLTPIHPPTTSLFILCCRHSPSLSVVVALVDDGWPHEWQEGVQRGNIQEDKDEELSPETLSGSHGVDGGC